MIVVYGTKAENIVEERGICDIYDEGDNVTRIVASQDGHGYLLGFKDGTVVRLNIIDLEVEETFKTKTRSELGKINDIWGNK